MHTTPRVLLTLGFCAFANAFGDDSSAPLVGKYGVMFKAFLDVPGLDSTNKGVGVWYPVGPPGQKFPFVAYAHGDTLGGVGLRGDYGDMFNRLASFGYIVAAHAACNDGCSDGATLPLDPHGFKNYYLQQLRLIDWAKTQQAIGQTVPFTTLNFDVGVGVAGHSMGAQSTLYSSSVFGVGHNVAAAVMHHAYTHSYPAPRVPFLAFTGSNDGIAPPFMTDGYYNATGAHSTKGFVNKLFSDHFEPNNAFPTYNPYLAQFTAAWFKIHLDKTPKEGTIDWDDMIFGSSSNSLCSGGDGRMWHCETQRGEGTVVV